jgi:hypothetical protein
LVLVLILKGDTVVQVLWYKSTSGLVAPMIVVPDPAWAMASNAVRGFHKRNLNRNTSFPERGLLFA